AAVPEDEYLSNLWRYDLRTSRWVQVTHFSGGADRWTIVRTPFLASDGSIQFVRMSGRASADRAPRYQLWRRRGNVARRLRILPGEMYLAGLDGSTPSIVDAGTQPAVVRPGVWALLISIAPGADAEAELARFRTAVPAFAGWSWIVSV